MTMTPKPQQLTKKEYPWYFEPNGVLDAWRYSRGQGVVVDLIDTCVDFSRHSLRNKNYSSVQICNFSNLPNEAHKMHGTAMCGLIVGSVTTLRDPYTQSMVHVSGIAPEAKIRVSDTGTEGIGYEKAEGAFRAAKQQRSNPIPEDEVFDVNLLKSTKIIRNYSPPLVYCTPSPQPSPTSGRGG